MSRKSVSFGQLLRYINAPQEKGRMAILHNLKSAFDYAPQIKAEFLENYKYIRSQKKGGVTLYHEILAVAEADRAHVTEEMLADLARKYLELRAPNALAYAKAQFNTASPHVHLLISGNLIESAKKLRLERKAFDQVKRELEAYQVEKYPQLRHSIVFDEQRHQKRDRTALTQGEHERIRRLKDRADKPPTQKEDARERLRACLTQAQDESHLLALLKASGLTPYVRGQTPGVTDTTIGRNYRLRTLGLDHERQDTIKRFRQAQRTPNQTTRRLAQLDDIALLKIERQWLKLGFRQEIIETFQAAPAAPDRQQDVQRIQQHKRQQARARGLDYDPVLPSFTQQEKKR